ncbi:MAG: T9SS type A sorting domain-containing protein, partial [Putridiphycobacter sp.]|nr:T9SS type A sorting domain-containing protein [Putridiphycobacter sp.]
SVKPVNNTALIEWKTAPEINNDYFEIEKSSNGSVWESLAIVQGAGNSSEVLDYQYVDEKPFPGFSYYRLKQIDFDGQLEIFQPVSLSMPELMIAISEFKIFPNPTHDILTISLSYLNNKEIRIYNMSGQLMSALQISDDQQVAFQIDVSSYPAGTYIVSDGENSAEFIKK